MIEKNGFCSAAFMLFLTLTPFNVMAAWQVSNPEASVPRDPFFQAGTERKTALTPSAPTSTRHVRYPNEYANYGKSAPVYGVSISGSLKDNLERIMHRYNWKVVWKAPYDYNFDGKVTGSSLPNVVQKLLQPFPLQAVMYMSNRTVAIVPRQIR